MDPFILNLALDKRVQSATGLGYFTAWECSSSAHRIASRVILRADLEVGVEGNPLLLSGFKPRFVEYPSRCLVIVATGLTRMLQEAVLT